jgi:ureidoacrylate peracid hydrolase
MDQLAGLAEARPTERWRNLRCGFLGAEFYQVVPVAGEPVVVKHRYSGFVGTDLEVILRAKERRSVLTTGVSTNVCV